MTDFEKYREILIGRTLTNLFFTKQDGPHDYMPGVTPAYYFSTVMELDNEIKYYFRCDYIQEWNGEEPLITLTNENWLLPKDLVFKGQKITDLVKDEYDQLVFHLENGTAIWHNMDFGDSLYIENPKYVHDVKTNETITLKNSPQERRTWWQKLYGS